MPSTNARGVPSFRGLEPTNEGYAVAKIAGLKMCEFYYKQYGFRAIAVMPCNLYGEHDLLTPVDRMCFRRL